MTPELHRQFENSSPYDMTKELKSMLEKQARVDRNAGNVVKSNGSIPIISEQDIHVMLSNSVESLQGSLSC
ncbi:hypothetical protein Tco_0191165 [Tanacetum coccineum]